MHVRWNNGVIHQKENGRWHQWTIPMHFGSIGFASNSIRENLSEWIPHVDPQVTVTDPLCMLPCRSKTLSLSTLSKSSDAFGILLLAAPAKSSESMPMKAQQHGLVMGTMRTTSHRRTPKQLQHNEQTKLSTCFLHGLTFIVSTCLLSHQSYQVSGTLVDPSLEQWQLRWEKQCGCLARMGLR